MGTLQLNWQRNALEHFVEKKGFFMQLISKGITGLKGLYQNIKFFFFSKRNLSRAFSPIYIYIVMCQLYNYELCNYAFFLIYVLPNNRATQILFVVKPDSSR